MMSPSGDVPIVPRWIQIVQSRWWFALVPIHAVAAWYSAYAILYGFEIFVLCVGVGVLLAPSSLYPESRLAKGWQVIAISWITLMIRQALFLFHFLAFGEPRYAPPWVDLFLIIIYLPGILLVGSVFYRLPFQRRSRLSLFLDCLAIGLSITALLWKLVGFDWQEVIFVGGNITVLYAVLMIYQQERQGWRHAFRATAIGLLALIVTDTTWMVSTKEGWPFIWVGPLYSLAWLIFPRAALAVPRRDIVYNEEALYLPPAWQDSLGSASLSIAVMLLLFTHANDSLGLAMVLLVLVIGIRVLEGVEYSKVQHNLDAARANEARLRRLVQGLGHDLKTPLNAIEMHANRILARSQDKAFQEDATDLREHHAILRQRIATMLEIAREQEAGFRIERLTFVSLSHELGQLLNTLAVIYRCEHISVNIQTYLATGQGLAADHLALIRVIENISINALQVQREQAAGEVLITFATADGESMIAIADRGPGYREQTRPHRMREESTGIGLIGARTLLQAMSGQLQLSDRPGGGTIATITLPSS